MSWPNKDGREEYEINWFIKVCARLPGAIEFEVVSKGEKPDYIVRDRNSGKKFGVELTSVYLNDRSVPDVHKKGADGDIQWDEKLMERYAKRLISAVIDKVCKARNGYDKSYPLILAIFMNEYISIYLRGAKLEEFVQKYKAVFESAHPFTEVVFWHEVEVFCCIGIL